MQRKHLTGNDSDDDGARRLRAGRAERNAHPVGSEAPPERCYGIQVLIAGRHKHWRDEVSAEIRRAGYSTTTVDSGVDALTILVLGLPIDVLVTDAELLGDLRCSRLAVEARALRPNLGIVFAGKPDEELGERVPDALVIPPGAQDGALAVTVREALTARA